MADNVTLPATGSGTATPVIASENLILGTNPIAQVQVVKLALGILDAYQKDLAAGQSNMAGSLPVTIASDQSAVPVSGTVTANAGTNLNTSALALEAGNLAAVAGVAGVTTGAAVTSDLAGTLQQYLRGLVKLLAGTLTVSGSVTANAGANLNTSALAQESGGNLAAVAGVAGTTTGAAVTGDNTGTLQQYLRGLSKIFGAVFDSVNNWLSVNIGTRTLTWATSTASASGDNVVVAADATHKIVVKVLVMQNESATPTTLILRDGTTPKIRLFAQNQGDGLSLVFPRGDELRGTVNTALNLNLSGANICGYSVGYFLE